MGKFEIQNSIFEDLAGPGLYVDKQSNLTLSNCIFSKCIGNVNGGGVYVSKCSCKIKNVCFTDCKGSYGSSLYIETSENHAIFLVSCLRCSSERTSGDSVYLDSGAYYVEYFNSTFSKSSQSSIFQFSRTKESQTNYLLGDSTDGECFIELYSANNPVTFQNSALTNNTANRVNVVLNGIPARVLFKKFIFSGNNKNTNRNCFNSLSNLYFEECTYLDKGSFGTNTLPSGVVTKETEVIIEKKFMEKWCLENHHALDKENKCSMLRIVLKILSLRINFSF